MTELSNLLTKKYIKWTIGSRYIFLENISKEKFQQVYEIIAAAIDVVNQQAFFIAPPADGFSRFQGIRMLASKLLQNEEDEQLKNEFERQMSNLPLSGKQIGLRDEDSIIQAVVRRISRESHHSSLIIDSLARIFLQKIKRLSKTTKKTTLICIDGLEYWDRPSLRVLHRINLLNEDTSVIWAVRISDHYPSFDDNAFKEKIIQSHKIFIEKYEAIQINKLKLDLKEYLPKKNRILLNKEKTTLHEIASELAYQNFERVYLLAHNMIHQDHTNEEISQVYRLVALADASKGDYQEANIYLEKALSKSTSSLWRAHIRYLQGLLYTKRYYDLKGALAYYQKGLDYLKLSEEKSQIEIALERAWLYNGNALIHALEAKKMDPQKASDEIKKSFDLEIKAYALAQLGKDARFSYLRHNLLANITFLFEIKKAILKL